MSEDIQLTTPKSRMHGPCNCCVCRGNGDWLDTLFFGLFDFKNGCIIEQIPFNFVGDIVPYTGTAYAIKGEHMSHCGFLFEQPVKVVSETSFVFNDIVYHKDERRILGNIFTQTGH